MKRGDAWWGWERSLPRIDGDDDETFVLVVDCFELVVERCFGDAICCVGEGDHFLCVLVSCCSSIFRAGKMKKTLQEPPQHDDESKKEEKRTWISNTSNQSSRRTNRNKLPLLRLLEQRKNSLEEQNRTDDIDLIVLQHIDRLHIYNLGPDG